MERRAVRSSNFETYNLITLFLNTDEIKALGALIKMDSAEFRHFADEFGLDVTFFYYLTGVPGAGKSTTVSYFRSLATYAEWPNPRPPELAKAFTDLTDDERGMVDSWVSQQFGIKNLNLLDQREGIHIIDRCPLDPLSFTPDIDWKNKAAKLLRDISPGKSNRQIQSGHVILLCGDEHIISVRLASRHKEGSAEYLKHMNERLEKMYNGSGCTELDIRSMSIPEMVKRIAHIVHLVEYSEVNLQQNL
jgi:predicted ATPase